MDEEPIEPEVVDRDRPRSWNFQTAGSPWALFGLAGALGALGALGIGAVLAMSVGWVFVLAWVYRWLWSHAFSPELTRLVYGADTMTYGKALATTALFVLVSWLVSPKKPS